MKSRADGDEVPTCSALKKRKASPSALRGTSSERNAGPASRRVPPALSRHFMQYIPQSPVSPAKAVNSAEALTGSDNGRGAICPTPGPWMPALTSSPTTLWYGPQTMIFTPPPGSPLPAIQQFPPPLSILPAVGPYYHGSAYGCIAQNDTGTALPTPDLSPTFALPAAQMLEISTIPEPPTLKLTPASPNPVHAFLPSARANVRAQAAAIPANNPHFNALGLFDWPLPQWEPHVAVPCRFCDWCKTAISSGADCIICGLCKCWLCIRCSVGHAAVHSHLKPRNATAQLRRWTAQAHSALPDRRCRGCSRDALERLQCECLTCDFALCLACAYCQPVLDLFFIEHAAHHDKEEGILPTDIVLTALYPEHWRVTTRWQQDPCSCLDVGLLPAIMHCERCHIALRLEQDTHWCRDCENNGLAQWLCAACCEQDEREHRLALTDATSQLQDGTSDPHRHVYIKAAIIFDPTIPDDMRMWFRCATCEIWLDRLEGITHHHEPADPALLTVHRPPDLQWFISPRLLDLFQLRLYSSCDKKRLLKSSVQHPDTLPVQSILAECCRCHFIMAYGKQATLCIAVKCDRSIYCASCTESGRIRHRHQDHIYVVTLLRQTGMPVCQVDCSKCGKTYKRSGFFGLLCGKCRCFSVCWRCIVETSRGAALEHAPGLPHGTRPGYLCQAANWLLIYECGKMPSSDRTAISLEVDV